ncbi:MAG TPA: helix-turn-helix domain-containing protein [Pyrinomonadaceae bacterium]|nr:helix-turn-helix domain-containing protein [Pyrinomonadaceae bacterium]
MIERASILEDSDQVSTAHLPADLLKDLGGGAETPSHFPVRLPAGGIALDDVEEMLVTQAYESTNHNLTRAARLLRISRDQLRYKLKKYGSYRPDGALEGESRSDAA